MIRDDSRGGFPLSSIYVVILLLNIFVVLSQGRAEAGFLDDLGTLAFDKKIEARGATIAVDSQERNGARFTINIPIGLLPQGATHIGSEIGCKERGA